MKGGHFIGWQKMGFAQDCIQKDGPGPRGDNKRKNIAAKGVGTPT